MDFPSRLKRLRIEHKLTQEQLGEKVNVTKVSISGYENGNRSPDIETLQKLAEVLGVNVDYLLGRTDKKESNIPYTAPLTSKDERDIAKRLEEIKKDMEHADGLAFDGEPMSEEAMESFLEAMEYVVSQTKRINKKYTPKKYRKENKDE